MYAGVVVWPRVLNNNNNRMNRLRWHKPKLRCHLTNVTKIHAVASVREDSREKLSLEPTLESWQRAGWTNVRLQCVPDSCCGNRESAVADSGQVRRRDGWRVRRPWPYSRCLDGRSLMHCRLTDGYAGASPWRHWYTRTAIFSRFAAAPATSGGRVIHLRIPMYNANERKSK